jgi:hypothetical protein
LDAFGITGNMVVQSPAGLFLIDAENMLVLREEGAAGLRVDSVPDLLAALGRRVVDSLAAPERRVTPIYAAGPAPEGVVVWTTGKHELAGGVLEAATGRWTLLRISPGVFEEFPTIPTDVMIVADELFVLADDGIRVYGLAEGAG